MARETGVEWGELIIFNWLRSTDIYQWSSIYCYDKWLLEIHLQWVNLEALLCKAFVAEFIQTCWFLSPVLDIASELFISWTCFKLYQCHQCINSVIACCSKYWKYGTSRNFGEFVTHKRAADRSLFTFWINRSVIFYYWRKIISAPAVSFIYTHSVDCGYALGEY